MNCLKIALLAALTLAGGAASAAERITTPKEAFGFEMGEDRQLANYTQLVAYWRTLAAESDRIQLVDIGATSENRRQMMAIVSSPENLKHLEEYRQIAAKLGRAEGISEAEARSLAARGKAVVWVDGGLHAAETETPLALVQEVYDLVSSDDPEARKILDNVIILFAQDNPDGQELVSDWYMRIKDPQEREPNFDSLPKLYHPYIGHDNNRDFYMAEMPETANIAKVLFQDWRPQIVLNQHQRGPEGTVVFMPPFRDPFNYHYDPLVMTELEELGATLHSRLISEGKPGSVTRSAAHYDTWYNGNLRTSSYFHNTIGILTEIIGMPSPIPIALVPENQLAHNDAPAPIAPQLWHMRQSVDYSLSINRALLNYAAANRERLLFNIYRMGANGIEKGGRDSWTITPDRIAALKAAAALSGTKPEAGSAAVDARLYETVLHDPAHRDPRAYVISPDQPDFPTAIRFLNALIKLGVRVDRATAPFSVGGRTYPAGAYVIRTGQAYRAHILDMFEPQNYPDNFQYPGGPPIPPADSSGYTLAYQMGVKFDRVLDGFEAPTTPTEGLLKPYPGRVEGQGRAGFVVSHASNNSVILTNRLQKAGVTVNWLTQPVVADGETLAAGALWIPASPAAARVVRQAAAELGLTAHALDIAPVAPKLVLKSPRIALVDLYGGLMPTGWTRWIFEQFEIPYTVVYPQRLDRGGLKKDFDVLLFTDSAIPNERSGVGGGMFRGRFDVVQPKPQDIPAEYRSWLGEVTPARTLPQVAAFAREGGAVIAIGSSATGLIDGLKLPVENALTETVDGKVQPMPRTKVYVPGALLSATVDVNTPLAYGMADKVDLFFDSSPLFRLKPGAAGAKAVAWFSGPKVLHSGWAWGQERLDGAVAAVELPYGKGKLFLFGPEVAMRAQTQGAFKLLFNGLYYGPATVQ